MAKVVRFPEKSTLRVGVTGRDEYLIVQALAYATECIDALPEWRRERSNRQDMRELLVEYMPDEWGRERLIDDVRGHLFGAHSRFLQKLNRLLDEDETGLLGRFLDQAIRVFASEVVKVDPAETTKKTNGWVSGEAWLRCAQQALQLHEQPTDAA